MTTGEKASLTIEAAGGTAVEVLYRDRGEDPPPPVYTGTIPANGTLTVSLPRGYFVILAPSYKTGIANFSDGTASKTVRLEKQ